METNSNMQLPGFFPLAKETLKVYKDKWGTLISLFLIIWAIPILATAIAIALAAVARLAAVPAISFTVIAGIAIIVILCLGIAWINAAAIIAVKERQSAIRFLELLRRAKSKMFAYLWVNILGGVAVAAGLIFFALPGIIIAVWIFAAGIIAVTEDKKGIAALAQSHEYARGNFLKIFLLSATGMFLFFCFNWIVEAIGNNLIESLAALAIMPLPIIFSYLIFEKLKLIKGDLPAPTFGQKNFFRAAAAIGSAIVILLAALAINFAPQIKQEYEIMRLQYQMETGQELPRLPI